MLKGLNFEVSMEDPFVCIGDVNFKQVILAIYVDDGIIAAESVQTFNLLIAYL